MEQVQQEKPQLSGMQAALLQRAMGHDQEADEMTSTQQIGQDSGGAVVVEDGEAIALRGVLDLSAAAVGVYLPKTGKVLADSAEPLADAILPVMQKYGWSMSGSFGVELRAAAVVVPVGFQLVAAMRQDNYDRAVKAAIAAEKEKRAAENGEVKPESTS